MAQTTEDERSKMRQGGMYMSEKCDKCGKPLTEIRYSKMGPHKNENWCPICGPSGKNLVAANLKEETRMKKEAKEKKGNGPSKLFGVILPGTAIYDLAVFLMDEKKRKLEDAMKSMSKHKADKMGRIHQLVRYAKKKKFAAITIDKEEGTIQMKLAKGVDAEKPTVKEEVVETKAKKSKKEEKAPKKKKEPEPEEEPEEEETPKKKKKKKEPEPEEGETTTEDESEVEETEEATEETSDEPEDEEEDSEDKALKSTALLVRRTLKAKADKEWTKNTLTEYIVKKNDGIDSKRVLAAINSEIKNGGLEVNEGNLQLA